MEEGYSDLGAFPHCSSPVIRQISSGFENLNQERAGLATTRNMVKVMFLVHLCCLVLNPGRTTLMCSLYFVGFLTVN